MNRYNSDMELFSAFHRGEEPAIQAVYQLHFKPLCFFAQRITADKEAAEDLVAESFIKMLEKRGSFQNLPNVKSFLYLATRNAGVSWLRSEKQHAKAHHQLRFLGEEGEGITGPMREELLRLEVLAAIHAEIGQLPGRCKEIFKLLFIEGLTTEQIAERMGIATQTVRTQKARALELIRAELLKKNLLPALILLAQLFPAEKMMAKIFG